MIEQKHIGLVMYIAHKYSKIWHICEDFAIDAGMEALTLADRIYNPSIGTYDGFIGRCIYRAIKREARKASYQKRAGQTVSLDTINHTDPTWTAIGDCVDVVIAKVDVQRLWHHLSARQAMIMTRHLWLRQSFEEIAEQEGYSRQYWRQLYLQAIDKLKRRTLKWN